MPERYGFGVLSDSSVADECADCESCGASLPGGSSFTVYFVGDDDREVIVCAVCAVLIDEMLGFPSRG